MMKIDSDRIFKEKLTLIGIESSEVSIFLPDEEFDCILKDEVKLNSIMFLGLNRSKPKIYSLPYHNMRGVLLEIFDKKNIYDKLIGAYLSDFIKDKILKNSGFNSKNSEGGVVFNFVKDKKNLLKESKEILEKEIKEFKIKKIFVFGKNVWNLLGKVYPNLDKDSRFIQLPHYSLANCVRRKNIPEQIIKELKK